MAGLDAIQIHRNNRVAHLNALLASIQACTAENKSADKERLIANCMSVWGASRRNVLELLKCLEMTEKIKIVGKSEIWAIKEQN